MSAVTVIILIALSVTVPVLVAVTYSVRYLRIINRHRAESTLWHELSTSQPTPASAAPKKNAKQAPAKGTDATRSSRIRTDATVLELVRPRRRMTTPGGHRNALAVVELRVQYLAAAGEEREARVPTLIEEALLPDFEAGSTVGIIYDRSDPSRIAMDRDRRALESDPTP
jgi:hypothetical protein